MTHPDNGTAALAAAWRHELLVVFLAVELSVLLDEAAVHERASTVGVGAVEVVRTPRLVERQHKRSPTTPTFAFDYMSTG